MQLQIFCQLIFSVFHSQAELEQLLHKSISGKWIASNKLNMFGLWIVDKKSNLKTKPQPLGNYNYYYYDYYDIIFHNFFYILY